MGHLLCAVTCVGECPKTDADGSKVPTEEIFPVDQAIRDCDNDCGDEKNSLEPELETGLYSGLDQTGQVHNSLVVPDLIHPLPPVQFKLTPALLSSSVLSVGIEELPFEVKLIYFRHKRKGKSEQGPSVAQTPVVGEHPGDD